METPAQYVVQVLTDRTTMDAADYVCVPRRELEQEHTHLLGRIQQLRRLLGYTPLPTGKQMRREQSAAR